MLVITLLYVFKHWKVICNVEFTGFLDIHVYQKYMWHSVEFLRGVI